MTRVRAYIGLGSNLGDRAANLWEATRRLGQLPTSSLAAVSRLYETEPVGPVQQGWFLNAVAGIETELDPRELLRALKAIEDTMGRLPSERWGPRLIDLDILLYGNRRIETVDLVVPHRELWNRLFVLVPLLDVVADAELANRVRARLRTLEAPEAVGLYEPQGGAARVVRAPRDGV